MRASGPGAAQGDGGGRPAAADAGAGREARRGSQRPRHVSIRARDLLVEAATDDSSLRRLHAESVRPHSAAYDCDQNEHVIRRSDGARYCVQSCKHDDQLLAENVVAEFGVALDDGRILHHGFE